MAHRLTLACELHWHQPLRAQRSGTTTTLHRPHASSDFHKHSFAVSAPATWNNIPASVRDSATLVTFKTAFKTHLFNSFYTSCHWLPSIGASDSLFHDAWHQLKKFVFIDKASNNPWYEHYKHFDDKRNHRQLWHCVYKNWYSKKNLCSTTVKSDISIFVLSVPLSPPTFTFSRLWYQWPHQWLGQWTVV